MLEAKFLAIPQKPEKISSIVSPGDNQDVPDSRIHQGLQRVINHGFVVHGKKMFVGDLG
jgi:hypothetical protein